MPIEKLRLLAVLIVSAGVTALLSGDFSIIFFLLLGGSVTPLCFELDITRIRNKQIWRVYGLSTFVIVGVMFWLRFPIKISVFLLVLFSIIYEFYGERRPEAPARLLPLLSFLVVLYEARIESGLNLMFGIMLYIFAIVWCLCAFHAAPRYDYRFWRIWRATWWPSLKIGSLILVLGLGFFWLIPRLEGQTLSAIPTLGGDRISGFGDRVNLNDIGSLKLSRKHILDLKPLSGPLENRYLKGRVLDRYEDGSWSSSMYALSYPLPEESATYVLRPNSSPLQEFAVDLEALYGNTLFFFDTLVELKGIPQPLRIVGDCDHLSVLRSFPIALSYTFKSAPESLPASGQADSNIFRQVPEQISADLERINASLVDVGDDLPTRVRKLERWFSQSFRYSLEVNNQGAKEPLLTFLNETRAGHCELFASAMVMLLRQQGYSARLVTGFYLPEIHASGNFYYVTESDAHAWVEVLQDNTWRVVDPTPASEPLPPRLFESQLASLKHFWRSKVMSWNSDRQNEAFAQGKGLGSQALSFLLSRQVLLPSILLALLVLWRQQRRKDVHSRLARLYLRCDQLLQRHCGQRAPTTGIYAYLAATSLSAMTQLEFRSFLDRYHQFRFAKSDSQQDPGPIMRQGRALLQRLRKELKG